MIVYFICEYTKKIVSKLILPVNYKVIIVLFIKQLAIYCETCILCI